MFYASFGIQSNFGNQILQAKLGTFHPQTLELLQARQACLRNHLPSSEEPKCSDSGVNKVHGSYGKWRGIK